MAGDSRSVAPDVLLQLAIAVPKIAPVENRPGLLLSILALSKNDPLIPRVVWQNLHPSIESNPNFVKVLREWWPVAGSQLQPLLPRISERLIGSKTLDPRAIATLLLMLESRDVSAGRLCLAALATRIQSNEIQGEGLKKLRSELEPVIAKHVGAGASHPLGLDAALVAASWKDDAAVGYVRQTFTTAGLAADLRLRALAALVAAGDRTLLDGVAAALAAKNRPGPRTGQPSSS